MGWRCQKIETYPEWMRREIEEEIAARRFWRNVVLVIILAILTIAKYYLLMLRTEVVRK